MRGVPLLSERFIGRGGEAAPAGVGARGVWFGAMMAAAALGTLPIGYGTRGLAGVACVALAAGVCGLSGIGMLVVQELCRDPRLVMLPVAAGFFLRMGIPLGLCMAIYFAGGPLVEAGFVFYLLGFYIFALAAGTLLGLRRTAPLAGVR